MKNTTKSQVKGLLKKFIPQKFHEIIELVRVYWIQSLKTLFGWQKPILCSSFEKLDKITISFSQGKDIDGNIIFQKSTQLTTKLKQFTLENVFVSERTGFVHSDTKLFADLMIEFPKRRKLSRFYLYSRKREVLKRLDEANYFCLPSDVAQNQFHILLDAIPKLKLLPKKVHYITNIKKDIPGLDNEQLLFTEELKSYFVKKLHVVRIEQDTDGNLLPTNLESINNLILGKKKIIPSKKFYISRSDASFRKIVNEKELYFELKKLGFEFVILTGKTMREQAELFASATHIVSMHGAGLSNIVFCEKNCKILEIFGPQYVADCYWKLASAKKLDYVCCIAKHHSDKTYKENVVVDVDKIIEHLRANLS
jgi:hypothetical protein